MLLVARIDVLCDSLRMLHKETGSIFFGMSTLDDVGAGCLLRGVVNCLYALLLSQLSSRLFSGTGTHRELVV